MTFLKSFSLISLLLVLFIITDFFFQSLARPEYRKFDEINLNKNRLKRFGGWGGGTYRYGPCGYGGCNNRGSNNNNIGFGYGGGGYSSGGGGSRSRGPCGSGEHHSAEVNGCGNKYGRK